MDLASLVRCWQITREQHAFNEGASDREIAAVEQELSLSLPPALRELYRFSDGLALFGGELSIYPLRNAANELSLSRVTPWLRTCNWPIPESVVIFGSTGTGDPVGLWTGSHSARFPEPIIQVGAIFEPACMAVCGSAVVPFLTVETARCLPLYGHSDLLQATLGVPKSIVEIGGDADHEAILRLADPSGIEILGDPYHGDPLDEDGLRKLLN
jgi:hypothetical protein